MALISKKTGKPYGFQKGHARHTNSLGRVWVKGQTAWNKGMRNDPEFQIKHPAQFQKGRVPWNKGKKIGSIRHSGQFKAGHSTWNKGFGTKVRYSYLFTKKIRSLIRERDGFRCQMCGCPQTECLKALDVHHIDYDKKNDSLRNLISLCKPCHTKTNHNKREYWKQYFLEKVEV